MISTRGATVTAEVIDTSIPSPTRRPKVVKTILYKVRFAKGDPVEVSGLLWDRGGTLEYASSTRGALWPSIIEKGYVVEHGGSRYESISKTVTPHEAMTNMLGPVAEFWLKEKPTKLAKALKRAPTRPTIADTWTTLPANVNAPAGIIGFHTYAVLDFRRDNVRVFNALDGAIITVPIATFERAFESVVQLSS